MILYLHSPCEHGFITSHVYRCDCSPDSHRYLGCPNVRCNGGQLSEVRAVPVVRMGGLTPAYYVAEPDDEPDGYVVKP